MKKTIALIFGGRSGEHEISIRSARTVLLEADAAKYNLVPIAITRDGQWLSPAESLDLFDEATAEIFTERYGEPPTQSTSIQPFPSKEIEIDCVFPLIHGTFGEDGTIQGLLEMAGMPYVGCGVLASACGMDKVTMKALFRDAGLPICKYTWFLRSEAETNIDAVLDGVERSVGYPCFVKPANLGSSVGISKADDRDQLHSAILTAAEYDRKIVVEEALQMREIECAVMGNDKASASRPGEYLIRDSSKAFLDYTEKYSGTGNNEFVVPAPLSDDLESKIRKLAVEAFKAIDGSGLARVDYFLRSDNGVLLVNEINTMPGLTDASGFPKMWAGTGISFPEVIDNLIELAIERNKEISRNKLVM